MLPHEYIEGNRLNLKLNGDLDQVIKLFKRGDRFICPSTFTISDGRIDFSKTSRTLTFLYGCEQVHFKNMKLKVVQTTEELTEIQSRIHTLKMIDVVENCPFAETTIKMNSMKNLIVHNCRLKIETSLDPEC
jgi:hypothetical protein